MPKKLDKEYTRKKIAELARQLEDIKLQLAAMENNKKATLTAQDMQVGERFKYVGEVQVFIRIATDSRLSADYVWVVDEEWCLWALGPNDAVERSQ